MTETWTYNSDGTLIAGHQGVTGQKYTSIDLVYGANNTPASEVWCNGASIVQTETWNANGTINNVSYFGITGPAYTNEDVIYGANNKPAEATYSNGMTETWTYNSDGTLQAGLPRHHRPEIHLDRHGLRRQQHAGERGLEQRLDRRPDRDLERQRHHQQRPLFRDHRSALHRRGRDLRRQQQAGGGDLLQRHDRDLDLQQRRHAAEQDYQGITGQKYTSIDMVYGANNTPASEVWATARPSSRPRPGTPTAPSTTSTITASPASPIPTRTCSTAPTTSRRRRPTPTA